MTESDHEIPETIRGKYVTQAIESGVSIDGEVIGHIALFDLDETALGEAREVAEAIGGVAAILRSSERSYHVWGLSIRPLEAILSLGDRLDAVDVEHTVLSDRRGCGVLRIDAKRDAVTGDQLKPAPRLIGVNDTPINRPQSAPHLDALSDLASDPIDRPAGFEWRGEYAERRVYMAEIRSGRRA